LRKFCEERKRAVMKEENEGGERRGRTKVTNEGDERRRRLYE
jgi:hypothetical protein